MDYISADIEAYALNHSTDLGSVLSALERETNLKVMRPRMLSGKLQGQLLRSIVQMIQPSNILEIGTYTGYSAICMASALPALGQLHTLEINIELEAIATKYFNAAGLSHCIHLHLGNALELIPQIDLPFDLVFMDADKSNYLNYYHLLIDRLNSGSWIIADNVLWSGKILSQPDKNDTETIALQAFNQFVQADNRVENLLLPLRDGLMLIRKK
jgi:predicted O-methyltransferase YrrM